MTATIRAGIGGWVFPPWRDTFYPDGLRQADELAFASRQVTAIEINATYYSMQKRESFTKWAAAAPDGFVFAIKGSRFCTNRRVLAEAGESLERFFGQGLAALGDRLGPILWQFMQTKRFDADDFASFLDLLPRQIEGLPLRHAVEVRNASFADAVFVDLCRDRGVAVCCSDHPDWPLIADPTADFVYARLMRGEDAIATGYSPEALDAWASRCRAWRGGARPADLPLLAPAPPPAPRDVFAFFISGGKSRAPAAAMALIERLG